MRRVTKPKPKASGAKRTAKSCSSVVEAANPRPRKGHANQKNREKKLQRAPHEDLVWIQPDAMTPEGGRCSGGGGGNGGSGNIGGCGGCGGENGDIWATSGPAARNPFEASAESLRGECARSALVGLTANYGSRAMK